MSVCRALLLAALMVATSFGAGAQFMGAPGTFPPGFGVRKPVCQQQAALWRETSKHGKAIEEALKRNALVQEACGLFKPFLLAEEQYVKHIEEHGQACGLVAYDLNRMRRAYVRAVQLGKDVCEATAQSQKRPLRELWSPGQDHKSDCRLCGKTGDFWWMDKSNSWPRRW
jgi:hypothetical protein